MSGKDPKFKTSLRLKGRALTYQKAIEQETKQLFDIADDLNRVGLNKVSSRVYAAADRIRLRASQAYLLVLNERDPEPGLTLAANGNVFSRED